MTYTLIYDASTQPFREWWFAAGLVAAGVWVVALQALLRRYRITGVIPLDGRLGALVLCAAVAGAALFTGATYGPFAALQSELRAGHARTVEGVVGHLRLGDPGGFEVTDGAGTVHTYAYSDHQLTPGYHRSGRSDEALRDGAYVRVADVGGHIARLEAAR